MKFCARCDNCPWLCEAHPLMLVAESGGPTMMARIGVMRALHRHDELRAPTPRKKRAKAYKIVR
jgi:hypothetical protein